MTEKIILPTPVEVWKPAIDFEDDYEVSSFGNVRAKARTVNHRYGTASRKEHIMSPTVGKRGYKVVSIHSKGKLITCSVHRLVAQTFLPFDHNRLFVNHIDGDKTNNNLNNLEWVTRSENQRHLFDVLGFKGSSYGTKGGTSSKAVVALRNDQVLHVFESGAAAAEFFKVSPSAINSAVKGKSKSCAGYQWLNINRLDEERATQAIQKLKQAIEDREGTTAVAE